MRSFVGPHLRAAPLGAIQLVVRAGCPDALMVLPTLGALLLYLLPWVVVPSYPGHPPSILLLLEPSVPRRKLPWVPMRKLLVQVPQGALGEA